jgi:hypothetical protein
MLRSTGKNGQNHRTQSRPENLRSRRPSQGTHLFAQLRRRHIRRQRHPGPQHNRKQAPPKRGFHGMAIDPGKEATPQPGQCQRHNRHRVGCQNAADTGRKTCTSPSRVIPPSGKMPTSSPLLSAVDTSAKAFSIITGSSLAEAIGIAPQWRKMKLRTGIRKIR